MSIQHRVIQNAELHEVKGASTAITGTVLKADGTGGTSFDRIGVEQLKGSLPTSVPDLQIVTDGAGGFKINQTSYGEFVTTFSGVGGGTYSTVASFTPRGMFVNGDGFSVTLTGLYKVNFSTALHTIEDPPNPTAFAQPNLIESGTLATVVTGASGLVTLLSGTIYRSDRTNRYNILRIA